MTDTTEIRKRAEAATPGPWRVDSNISAIREGPENRYGKMVAALYHGYQDGSPNELPRADLKPNLDFIAHARQDIPYLLDTVDALRLTNAKLVTDGAWIAGEVTRLRSALEKYGVHGELCLDGSCLCGLAQARGTE